MWLNICPAVNDIRPVTKGEFWRPQIEVLNSGTLSKVYNIQYPGNVFLILEFLGFKRHTTVGEGQMVPQNFVQRN